MSNDTRKRKRSESLDIDDHDSSGKIPEEFFCPISNSFISEPVRIPASRLTYDRDSVKELYETEDLQPDFRMFAKMKEHFSRYDLDPPFDFISSEEDLVVAINSVLGRPEETFELKRAILQKPWLLRNGGGIRCVTKFLSCPDPTALWVITAVSIVACPENEDELLVPADIHPEYSLLGPISRACDSGTLSFIAGLINLMHAFLMSSPDISAMAGKLGEIIKALVSHLWPVELVFPGSYPKLLIVLDRLSDNEEFCERMVDAEVVEKLLSLLDFSVSSEEDVLHNLEKHKALCELGFSIDVAQRTTLNFSLKILDRLCECSERAGSRIERMVIGEVRLLSSSLRKIRYIDREDVNNFFAISRILRRIHRNFDWGDHMPGSILYASQ